MLLMVCAGLSFEAGRPLLELKKPPSKNPMFSNPLGSQPASNKSQPTSAASVKIPQSVTQPLFVPPLQSRTITTFGAESNQPQSILTNSHYYPTSATLPRKPNEYRTIVI